MDTDVLMSNDTETPPVTTTKRTRRSGRNRLSPKRRRSIQQASERKDDSSSGSDIAHPGHRRRARKLDSKAQMQESSSESDILPLPKRPKTQSRHTVVAPDLDVDSSGEFVLDFNTEADEDRGANLDELLDVVQSNGANISTDLQGLESEEQIFAEAQTDAESRTEADRDEDLGRAARSVPVFDWRKPPIVNFETKDSNINSFRRKTLVSFRGWFRQIQSLKNLAAVPPSGRLMTLSFWSLIGLVGVKFFHCLFIACTPRHIQEKYGQDEWDTAWILDLYDKHGFWSEHRAIGPSAYKIGCVRHEGGQGEDLIERLLDGEFIDGLRHSSYDGSTMPATERRFKEHRKNINTFSRKFREFVESS
ncbi:hypothetical protein KVT40_003445 [Elsinoe batatas]|uniref:Uncharacterized protein n=1 Tax=Elsinoe batatas TaxID=2601811 RepID=A0A8K0PEU3_9PEZI|nr:hypothetical protein KVT40_003445 [Elsinoe batatas]